MRIQSNPSFSAPQASSDLSYAVSARDNQSQKPSLRESHSFERASLSFSERISNPPIASSQPSLRPIETTPNQGTNTSPNPIALAFKKVGSFLMQLGKALLQLFVPGGSLIAKGLSLLENWISQLFQKKEG